MERKKRKEKKEGRKRKGGRGGVEGQQRKEGILYHGQTGEDHPNFPPSDSSYQ